MDIFSAKFLFLAVVALVVLGPDKLPGALRGGGRLLSEFRRLTAQAQEHSQSVLESTGLAEPLAELRSIGQAVTAPMSALRAEMHNNLRLDPSGSAGEGEGPSEVLETSSNFPLEVSVEASGEAQEHLELVWP